MRLTEKPLASGAQRYFVKPADGDNLTAEVIRLITESKATSRVEIAAYGEDSRGAF